MSAADVAAAHLQAQAASLGTLALVGLILLCMMGCRGSGPSYAALEEDEDDVALTPGTSGVLLSELSSAILREVNQARKRDAKAKGRQVVSADLIAEDKNCTVVVRRSYRADGAALADFSVFADERDAKTAMNRLGPQTRTFGADGKAAELVPVQSMTSVPLAEVKALSERWVQPPWEILAQQKRDKLGADQKLRA